MSELTVVALSDTHGLHDHVEVPDGDILIHAGDISNVGELAEIEAFDAFLAGLPHPHKVMIAGNHDFGFEREPEAARSRITHAHYLQDELIEFEGIRIYGSPWQPWFMDWAFNLPRGHRLREKWALIPDNVDILITHGPPHGILDRTVRGEHVGCEELGIEVRDRIRPRYHIFGHIHEGAGRHREGGTEYVNASICDARYRPLGRPACLPIRSGRGST